MMDTFGNRAEMAGGRAAMGSSRYSLTSSSLNGTEAQKYEKVLLSGIISPRKRSANWPTLSLERSGCADIGWGRIVFILTRGGERAGRAGLRGASLSIVLIVHRVTFREHSPMQEARNQNSAGFLAKKYDVLATLHSAQAT